MDGLELLKDLYNRYKDAVYRTSMRYVKNEEDAKDVVQDVFLKVHRSVGKFRGHSEWFTWIYRITINTCLDRIQRDGRRIQLLGGHTDEVLQNNLEVSSEQCLSNLTVDKLLKNTSPVDRDLVVLVYAEGLSHSEAALVVGVSRPAVTKRLKKMKKKWRYLGSAIKVGIFLCLSLLGYKVTIDGTQSSNPQDSRGFYE